MPWPPMVNYRGKSPVRKLHRSALQSGLHFYISYIKHILEFYFSICVGIWWPSVLAFHCWDEISEINNLKRGNVYFGLRFQRFRPWSLACCCGPVVRQNNMVGSSWWNRAVHLVMVGSRERGEGVGRRVLISLSRT